jgi:hypothetical protein
MGDLVLLCLEYDIGGENSSGHTTSEEAQGFFKGEEIHH